MGLNIPLPGRECRKLKYYDRLMQIGQYEAAARIFCELKEVKKAFERDEMLCREAVLYVPDPTPQMMMRAPAREIPDEEEIRQEVRAEIEDEHEQVEYRMAQQQNLLASQKEELEQLRREAEELRRRVEAEEAAEKKSQQKFRQLLEQKEAPPEQE